MLNYVDYSGKKNTKGLILTTIVKNSHKEFQLTRAEILKLAEIAKHFNEIDLFTVVQDSSSGIGISTVVKFDLFNKKDTSVDITDLEAW